LALGTGAGAAGRNAIGTAVLGGMVLSTLLGIFFVPVFFVVVRKMGKRLQPTSAANLAPSGENHPG